jgi:hypothetical protein
MVPWQTAARTCPGDFALGIRFAGWGGFSTHCSLNANVNVSMGTGFGDNWRVKRASRPLRRVAASAVLL